MNIRREGSALWITDDGFYEPPSPRRHGRPSRGLLIFIVLAIGAVIFGAMWGLNP